MFKEIENPAACKMRSVTRFLNAKNMKPAEIYHQLCDVCGEHATSSSMVWRWVRLFNEVKDAITTCFASQAASFYDERIQKVVQRYNKCLNNGGSYVKKQCTVCTSNGNLHGL
jgi:hypothetical protein